MWIIKASGEMEKFDANKIRRTCVRAGASKELAEKISKQVQKKAYDGISTKEVLDLTLRFLDREMPHIAARYDLKGALFRLGPAGFPFERFAAEILKEYGYQAKVHSIVSGACIDHEVDIIASKAIESHTMAENIKYYMIECKYHNSPGIYTGVRDVLYTYARFLDLQDGWKVGKCQKFDQPWLICNTKFSTEVIKYATCKNMKLTGWNYPTKNGLHELIEEKSLYPITVLRKLDFDTQMKLAESGLMLALDLVRKDIEKLQAITKIPKNKLEVLIAEAKKVCFRITS